MVTRRSEIPSLDRAVTRTVKYASGRGIYGPKFETLERSARVRRLEISAKDQYLFLGGSDQIDKAYRRYLARPVSEELSITFDDGGEPELRSISLAWAIGDSFEDSSRRWTVIGIGFFDSSGRMLELLTDSAR